MADRMEQNKRNVLAFCSTSCSIRVKPPRSLGSMSATSVFRCVQHWPGDREWAGIKISRFDERGRIVEH
jgi:hypothetical protein